MPESEPLECDKGYKVFLKIYQYPESKRVIFKEYKTRENL